MDRRSFLRVLAAASFISTPTIRAELTMGQRLARAASAQVGVTNGYDPSWAKLRYPGGDVPRNTGVCADVVIRAARDALGLDLQQLVHEDMSEHFAAYPAHRIWGSTQPDSNIDHRRVLNLECFFQRSGARLWKASGLVAGDAFPASLAVGDIVTWLLDARLPHIAIVVTTAGTTTGSRVVHNIGRGAEDSWLSEFRPHRAVAHYRWPLSA